MRSTRSLLNSLKQDFPSISFHQSGQFHWSPETKTITYTDTNNAASLLHEVAHAALGHDNYEYDIELLKMEREAWSYTTSHLAVQYDVVVDEDTVEEMLDTYRDWLHNRSLCPHCEATGIQQSTYVYMCLACSHQWRVNEARTCALRRYPLKSERSNK